MLKIPYGISDFKALINEDYYYVDKTMYLPKLEEAGKVLTYLRPGRFGKTLFTSMMYYYYDINSKDLFDDLFKNTYIYNNPTIGKNNYYILKLDFSGITASLDRNNEQLEESFKACVITGIDNFVSDYDLEYTVKYELNSADILKYFLSFVHTRKLEHKLYIIIDEYDNFTNAILKGNGNRFKEILSSEGFIHAFYANIKQYTGTIIDRVFITGICPITLNAMTTGFNIAKDISGDKELHSMIGLTHMEVKELIGKLNTKDADNIYNTMIKNYDGYLFNKDTDNRVFNATLVMYFMDYYNRYKKAPDDIIDANISFNYDKIENCLKLQNNKYYEEILNVILKDNTIDGSLTRKFNLEIDFTKDDIISLIYYFGYLTIGSVDVISDKLIFKIPNYVMKEVYGSFFEKLLADIDIEFNDEILSEIFKEMIYEGKINKLSSYVSEILKSSDNRILIKFDEKYISLIYYTLIYNNRNFTIYNEYPCTNGYIDVMIMSNSKINKYNIMIELKYIKVSDYNKDKFLVDKKKSEAINQIKSYSLDERIDKDNLKKYVVIFVGNDVKVIEEI